MAASTRVGSVDLIRGAVMILMAIDHVRVYAGLPPGGPTAGIFFTRWVTHFCAPAFLFLAGTSAFFYGRTHQGLPRFLVTRGLWLVFLELTVLRLAWTFNFDIGFLMGGVIWVIGLCMILMAGVVRLSPAATGLLGVAIVAGHNLLDGTVGTGASGWLWKILYVGFWDGPITLGAGGPTFIVLYSVIPWIGVMAAGYGFGQLLTLPAERRDRLCLVIGLGATALFVVLRGFNLYGEPRPWSGEGPMPAWLAFLNTTKYPASLQFLLMTLGPCIALVPLLERARGWAADVVTVFGRVPFLYYMLHIPLIHLLALGVAWLRAGTVSGWLFTNHPMGPPPPPAGYPWTLWQLYAVFAVAIALLYPVCRWFARVKATRAEWWVRYL